MNKLTEIPEAIILTMPKSFFGVRYTVESFEAELRAVTEADDVWYRICKNLPVHEVLYAYLVYDNIVQLRTNIAGYERGVTKHLYSHADNAEGVLKEFVNVNTIMLCGPVIKAPEVIPFRGCQGFRYVDKLFF